MADLALFGVLGAIAGSIFRLLQMAVGFSLLPRLRAAATILERRQLIARELRFAVVIAALGSAAILALTPPIEHWLLDGKYHLPMALLVAALFSGIAKIAHAFARATATALATPRELKLVSFAGWLSAAFAIGSAVIAAPWGLTGVIYGIGVGWLAWAVMSFVVVSHHFRKRLTDPLVAWALLTMLVVSAFFFALMMGPADPFVSFDPSPGFDGPGPNPLLQNHILMAFHPPMLYLGYVGFTVPFSFAIAALVTGRLGEGWLVATRRWTLIAWGFLTVGIIAGAWWSYEVLGWAGYWAWDPVENASFLPWLCGTAYLHSVMVQERRGMLRVWNLSLLCATFSLTILGTFLTRSGVIESVHAFSEGSVGPLLLGFFGLVVVVAVVGVGLLAYRNRPESSIESGIRSFRREMRALAPPPEHGPTERDDPPTGPEVR